MRKLIIFASFCMSVGMAIALANAEDKPTSIDMNSANQPGTMGTDNTNKMSGETPSTGETSVRSSTETRTAKICTDSSGTTYHDGKKGYKECMKTTEKNKHPEQMGGQVNTTQTTTETSSDTSSDAPAQ